jgi:thiamine biosynthesis lipoprotein ApbE
MGTHGTISILGDSNDKNIVASCMKAALDELLLIENLLSHYIQGSEVSILNREGSIKNPSKDLLYIWRITFTTLVVDYLMLQFYHY